jgi:DnaJ family protein A protein 2
MSKSLYEILEVDRNASSGDIKKSYFRLAKIHHPDKGGDAEIFKQIQKAYETLTDDQKRAIYDQTGQIPGEEVNGGGGGGPMPGGFPFPFPFPFGPGGGGPMPGGGGGININIDNLFGMFNGGRNGKQNKKREKGPDFVQDLQISLEQLYKGHSINVAMGQERFCPKCTGSGCISKEICKKCNGVGMYTIIQRMGGMVLQSHKQCDDCKGEGTIAIGVCDQCNGNKKTTHKNTHKINILPGMREGETFTFTEACSENMDFEKPGDVKFILKEAVDENWKRMGVEKEHLATTVIINVAESLLGTTIYLEDHPGIDNLYIRLPPASFEGDVFCVGGKGMPKFGKPNEYGNLYLKISVEIRLEDRVFISENSKSLLAPFLQHKVRKNESVIDISGESVDGVDSSQKMTCDVFLSELPK